MSRALWKPNWARRVTHTLDRARSAKMTQAEMQGPSITTRRLAPARTACAAARKIPTSPPELNRMTQVSAQAPNARANALLSGAASAGAASSQKPRHRQTTWTTRTILPSPRLETDRRPCDAPQDGTIKGGQARTGARL